MKLCSRDAFLVPPITVQKYRLRRIYEYIVRPSFTFYTYVLVTMRLPIHEIQANLIVKHDQFIDAIVVFFLKKFLVSTLFLF